MTAHIAFALGFGCAIALGAVGFSGLVLVFARASIRNADDERRAEDDGHPPVGLSKADSAPVLQLATELDAVIKATAALLEDISARPFTLSWKLLTSRVRAVRALRADLLEVRATASRAAEAQSEACAPPPPLGGADFLQLLASDARVPTSVKEFFRLELASWSDNGDGYASDGSSTPSSLADSSEVLGCAGGVLRHYSQLTSEAHRSSGSFTSPRHASAGEQPRKQPRKNTTLNSSRFWGKLAVGPNLLRPFVRRAAGSPSRPSISLTDGSASTARQHELPKRCASTLIEPNSTGQQALYLDRPSLNGRASDVHRDICTSFSLDIMRLRGFQAPLAMVAREALLTLRLDKHLSSLSLNKFFLFVERIAANYSDCSYHNQFHAADVTSRLCCILLRAGITRSPMDSLSALVAAIIHDVDHKGLSNRFLAAADNDLAMRWHGVAVLENHSLELAFTMMHHHSCNFISEFTRAEQQAFRSSVVEIVLATDQASHFELCDAFKSKVLPEPEDRAGDVFKSLPAKERILVLKIAMKCADIGHCCAPLEQHLQWCRMLEDEMFLQGDKEKEKAMPLSPLCNRDEDGVTCPHIQAGFLHGLVVPMVSAFVAVFPSSQPLLDMAQANLRHWEAGVARRSGSQAGD